MALNGHEVSATPARGSVEFPTDSSEMSTDCAADGMGKMRPSLAQTMESLCVEDSTDTKLVQETARQCPKVESPPTMPVTSSLSDGRKRRSSDTLNSSSEGLRQPQAQVGKEESRSIKFFQSTQANDKISAYLTTRGSAFTRCMAIREQCWQSSKGEKLFKAQQDKSDRSSRQYCRRLFELMKVSGNELQAATSGFTITRRAYSLREPQQRILDFCAAPGGFLSTALECNKRATAKAFTLAQAHGGHGVLIKPGILKSRVDLTYQDITLLAADMDINAASIPTSHPDAAGLLGDRQIPADALFDLAICDGQVLRTQNRAEYRELRESRRLLSSQLALALEHMRQGGTMIVLLHKVEQWECIKVLYRFDMFSEVVLFKGTSIHGPKSSFYLVAKNVQSGHESARVAVKAWKKEWEIATFGSDDEFRKLATEDDEMVDEVLETFGEKLAKLGSPIWNIQADALSRVLGKKGGGIRAKE